MSLITISYLNLFSCIFCCQGASSFKISLSVFLSSLFVALSLSFFLHFSLSPVLPFSLSRSHSVHLSLSFFYLSLSVSLFFFLSLYLNLSPLFFLSLPYSTHLQSFFLNYPWVPEKMQRRLSPAPSRRDAINKIFPFSNLFCSKLYLL